MLRFSERMKGHALQHNAMLFVLDREIHFKFGTLFEASYN
jgi:hypothetical protein